MKSIVLVFSIFLLSGIVLGQPVKQHGQLTVKGTALVDEHGDTTVLRGMSFGWHNLWPRFYNADVVKWLHEDWNCNVVRAAMGVELNDDGYANNPSSSADKVTAVVDGAIKEGIYVIIDFHSHNIKLPEALTFFKKMATKYGKFPNVIYEVFNEPDYETWPEVKAYSLEVIKTIREVDPDNIILVGSPHWDQDINLPAADPIMGYLNLMYTMHFYAGTHRQYLRDRTEAAMKAGLPVFVSESAGMEASGDGAIDEAEWQQWIDWMESKKLSWLTWSVSDKDETCSVLKPSASSHGGWKEKDLKLSGVMIRNYLIKYNSKE